MAVNIRDIPRLTGMNDYPAWKTSISAAFLILDLSSAIYTSPAPSDPSALPPDPLPSLILLSASNSSASLTSEEKDALSLLTKKKQEWDNIKKEQDAKREKEQKRKNEVALGWMFLTIEKTLAQELLLGFGKKRGVDGDVKSPAEVRELNARKVWDVLATKFNPKPREILR
jgi:hypothetical protein